MTGRYAMTREELDSALADWGEPRYRGDQIWEGLFGQRRPLDGITSVGRSLRERVADRFPEMLQPTVIREGDEGMTVKFLWRAEGDVQIETVLMRSPGRATVCVSSQAGCAMGCTFCATGQAGFERHLSAGEIVEQVARAQHAAPERVGNVVFMGMGEPLANPDAVLAACERLNADLGISARHITVSTVGVVPGMERLAAFPLPVTLAVSLHAPDDELRTRLVPLDSRYPIVSVLAAARDYAARKGRRVSFEYACISEVNDRIDQAEQLATLLVGFRGGAHVNLIPLNPTGGFAGSASSPGRLAVFARALRERGVNATIRRNRGTDIDAACGQLRARAGLGEPAPATDPDDPRE